jgi:UDP-3-O-[3-hydroxymyristoyl] glucosamine N-acyltransferase
VYDGTTDATISNASLVGVVTGDDVTIATSVGTFAQANVGDDIAVTAALTLSGDDIGNYTLTQPASLTADITPKTLTIVDATADDKVYDGTTDATISNASLVGVVTGDDVTIATSVGTFAQANVGDDIAVTAAITISGDDIGNYTLTQPSSLTADITPKTLTIVDATADDKVYDGTTDATISNASLVGVVTGDDVTIATSVGTFAQANVGDDIAVTAAITISGDDIGNYTLTQPASLTADITPKTLTIVDATADDKVYDGTTDATISNASLVGVVGNDDVSIATSVGTFAQANVGDDIAVTAALTLSGDDIGNYTLTQPASLTADITPKTLTIVDATADDKVYDGTTDATISNASLVGVVGNDDVTIATSVGTFAQANVGDDIAVTAAITISGDDIGNYTLTQPSSLTADITPKTLTIVDATADDKVYDGTTDATISNASLVGVVTGDDVTIATSVGTFAQANVGDAIVVTAALTISGDDIGNYTLTQPAGLTADITPKTLTIVDATADDKVYDGTTDATISNASLVGVVTGDDVTIATSVGTFAQANVGDAIVVTAALTLSGDDIGNYTLTQPAGLTADITPKTLTIVDATADDKVYDGTTDATISNASLVGVVTGDDVTIATSVGTFAQANVGDDIAVTAAITISGDDIGNYTLTQPAGLTADITPKTLTIVDATADDKVYDGTTDATISNASLVGVVTGDDVTIATSVGTFAQANVGDDIAVTAALTLSGDDIGNYTLTQPASLTADITPKT